METGSVIKRILIIGLAVLVLAWCLVFVFLSGVMRSQNGTNFSYMGGMALGLSWLIIPSIIVIVCNIKRSVEYRGAKTTIRAVLSAVCCSVLAYYSRCILGIGYALEVDLRYIDFQLENNGTVFFGDGV